MVQWLARLPGMQGIRGSSPGRGVTDFCTVIHLFISQYTAAFEKKFWIAIFVMIIYIPQLF